ncbi:hypothetical protein [Novosphingobium sp. PASSN1]|uniref:hypothetical protein n=1 Tax=Novosphingobium sp. PASSN1 TaxID=2015561 RepID=UPI000BD7A116|nr:hypothetical protein [Novosphingobium sp. PASSN1]OYU34197.1 MAG: hypothetical protein CFE35_16405 [Novosphingobium sp. PASSN1]
MDFLGRFFIGFVLGPVLVFGAIFIFGSIAENPALLLWPAGMLVGLLVIAAFVTSRGARTFAPASDREPLPPASLSPPQPDVPPAPLPLSAARRAEHARWRRDYRGWQFKSPRK